MKSLNTEKIVTLALSLYPEISTPLEQWQTQTMKSPDFSDTQKMI